MKENNRKMTTMITGGIAVVSLLIGIVGGWFGNAAYTSHVEKKKAEGAANTNDGALIDYEDAGYLKLGTYQGVVLDMEPTEEEIKTAISDMRSQHTTKKAITLKDGDVVCIDFKGYIDGKEMENGSAEDYSLTLGSGEFLADFEKQLVGKKVGQTVKIKATFPEDYGDETVNGKTADFTVKIKNVAEAYTDALVKKDSKGKFNTIAEYEADLKKTLKEEKAENKNEDAWSQVLESCELVKTPGAYKKIAQDDVKLQYQNFADQQGSTLEEVLANFGMTEEDLPSLAEDSMKERMIAKTIAKKQNITVDDAYLTKYLKSALALEDNDKTSLAEMTKNYKSQMSSRPKDDALVQKVKEFVGSKSVATK